MSALSYNKQRSYDTDTVKRIQQTVGVSADGLWGPTTVRAIKRWQRLEKLDVDGKVGPGTLEKFKFLWSQDEEAADDEGLDDVPDDVEEQTLPESDDDDDDDDDKSNSVAVNAESIETARQYFDKPVDIQAGSAGDNVAALQHDLFAFGFEPGSADGRFGAGGAGALKAFQAAAQTSDRVVGYQSRSDVGVTFQGLTNGICDAATRAEIKRWKEDGYRYVAPDAHYVERRVKVKNFSKMPRSSALLEDVPSIAGRTRRLHGLAAAAFVAMGEAAKQAIGEEVKSQSGWRPHRWKSRADYEAKVIARYGSVRKGRRYLAYSSPHETGLAVDIGTGGLSANSRTIKKQKQTPLWKWLCENAWRFGWYPYKVEPWHWEFSISYRAWQTGISDWDLSIPQGED